MKSSSDGGTQVLLLTSALLSVFSYCLCVLSVPYAPSAAVATGHSWRALRVVTNASSIGGASACGTGCSALGPTIVADNTTGRLFMLFAYIPRDMDTHTDLLLQGSHSICMVSTMDGVNWSPPRNLSEAAAMNRWRNQDDRLGLKDRWCSTMVAGANGIQLSTGRLVVPAYHLSCTSPGHDTEFSNTVYSDDF